MRLQRYDIIYVGFPFLIALQGQEVEGNQQGGVKINKQRTWRQYMNRYVAIYRENADRLTFFAGVEGSTDPWTKSNDQTVTQAHKIARL